MTDRPLACSRCGAPFEDGEEFAHPEARCFLNLRRRIEALEIEALGIRGTQEPRTDVSEEDETQRPLVNSTWIFSAPTEQRALRMAADFVESRQPRISIDAIGLQYDLEDYGRTHVVISFIE